MKNYLIKANKLFWGAIITLCIISCNDNDSKLNTELYQGQDISSYVSVTGEMESQKIIIGILKDGGWKLYSGNNESVMNFEYPLLEGFTKGNFDLDINRFQVYCLEWANQSRYTFGLRQLPIQGQYNFRDLGGYRTGEGYYVKWGLVFRSGKCNGLTNDDLTYLTTIPLKTIIDFRMNSEKDAEPNRVPRTVEINRHLPITPGNLGGTSISEAVTQGDIEAVKQFMMNINKSLVTNWQNEYKEFFAMLMDKSNTPLVFHCTAGKDRTGFAAALFLSALGVDRETIIEDYLLTNAFTNMRIEDYNSNNVSLCMYYLQSVQREYITAAFEAIEQNYGSVESFLTYQLDVDIMKLRDLYLN